MTTFFSVQSGRCDRRTLIKAVLAEGEKIRVTIKSTCPEVQQYAEALKEVYVADIIKPIMANPIYIKASPNVGPECPVPCAVISTTWTEAELVSKNLLHRFPVMSIKYEEKPDEQNF